MIPDQSSTADTAERRLSVAVLLICHNRRETTLRALRALETNAGTFDLRPVLFDDASTDGTAEAVSSEFPGTIIVHGDGNAYWNGGQYRAWSKARELGADAYLWLNDDVELDPDALERLERYWRQMAQEVLGKRFILSAATRGAGGEITYGGVRLTRSPLSLRMRLVEPEDKLAPIDTFNGNIVLVPKEVVDEIGINDPFYFHNFGDYDYGLRASRAGIAVRLVPGTLGFCEANYSKQQKGFGSPSLSIGAQWRKVNTHHGLPFTSWWRFTRRFSGAWFPFHFLMPYRVLLGFRRKSD